MSILNTLHVCMLGHFSHAWLFVTRRACQALLSMGFSRQEYWSGSPCPPPGDLSDPGIEPTSLMFPALSGRFFITRGTWEVPAIWIVPLFCQRRFCIPEELGKFCKFTVIWWLKWQFQFKGADICRSYSIGSWTHVNSTILCCLKRSSSKSWA